jgi:hypothetical protein
MSGPSSERRTFNTTDALSLPSWGPVGEPATSKVSALSPACSSRDHQTLVTELTESHGVRGNM